MTCSISLKVYSRSPQRAAMFLKPLLKAWGKEAAVGGEGPVGAVLQCLSEKRAKLGKKCKSDVQPIVKTKVAAPEADAHTAKAAMMAEWETADDRKALWQVHVPCACASGANSCYEYQYGELKQAWILKVG